MSLALVTTGIYDRPRRHYRRPRRCRGCRPCHHCRCTGRSSSSSSERALLRRHLRQCVQAFLRRFECLRAGVLVDAGVVARASSSSWVSSCRLLHHRGRHHAGVFVVVGIAWASSSSSSPPLWSSLLLLLLLSLLRGRCHRMKPQP